MKSHSFKLSFLITCYVVVKMVHGHSWLVCTDYMEKNAHYYETQKCRGHPRAANLYLKRKLGFGAESGYDHIPREQQPCRVRRNDFHHYDSEYPMAVYYPGQQVVLAHPMKEHGADADCTNPYIPDLGSWLFRSEVNQPDDPTLSQFRQNKVFNLGVSPVNNGPLSTTYPKPGFQNAPAFCLNQDKSLGTYSFNVPLDLSPGRYTFFWLWAFDNKINMYSTCFEVHIVSSQVERNRALLRNGFINFTEPCGGMTSNPDIRGVCNMPQGIRGANDRPGGTGGSSTMKHDVTLLILSFILYEFLS